MSHAADARAEAASRLGLAEALRWAVPLRIAELRRLPDHTTRRRRLPHGTVARLGAGDAILFHGGNPRNAILTFDAYAWAVAFLAVETACGVDFLGVHFCAAPHDGCPHDRPAPEPDPRPWWKPLAELEELARAEGITVPARPAATPAPAPPAPRRVETLHLPGTGTR